MERVSRASLFNNEEQDGDIELDKEEIDIINAKLQQSIGFDLGLEIVDGDVENKEDVKEEDIEEDIEEESEIFRLFSTAPVQAIKTQVIKEDVKRDEDYYIAKEDDEALEKYESAVLDYEDVIKQAKTPWSNCFFEHKVHLIKHEEKKKLSKSKKMRMKLKQRKIEAEYNKRIQNIEAKKQNSYRRHSNIRDKFTFKKGRDFKPKFNKR